MSAWKSLLPYAPVLVIALVGFGVYCTAAAWKPNRFVGQAPSFEPLGLAIGCAALVAALCLYTIWNRKP
ncbi:hypothetical protein PS850_04799 [Pseudomonas fluorescens]|jgi:hypothetical protein|nr:hypothetical protein PS850_04799 [Pseudomonas fluorescens]